MERTQLSVEGIPAETEGPFRMTCMEVAAMASVSALAHGISVLHTLHTRALESRVVREATQSCHRASSWQSHG